MRLLFLPSVLALCILSSSAQAQSRPIPRGIREADQTEAQIEKNIPPPIQQRTSVDPEKLQQEANELALLSQSIPAEINQTAKGTLPKDLNQKLKRIEKLAKQVRNELNR